MTYTKVDNEDVSKNGSRVFVECPHCYSEIEFPSIVEYGMCRFCRGELNMILQWEE